MDEDGDGICDNLAEGCPCVDAEGNWVRGGRGRNAQGSAAQGSAVQGSGRRGNNGQGSPAQNGTGCGRMGQGRGFVDLDGDGICDYRGIRNPS